MDAGFFRKIVYHFLIRILWSLEDNCGFLGTHTDSLTILDFFQVFKVKWDSLDFFQTN